MGRFFGLLGLLIISALVLVACGGEATSTPAPPTTASNLAGTATPVTNLTTGPTAVNSTSSAATITSTVSTSAATTSNTSATTIVPKSSPSTAAATATTSSNLGLPVYSGLKAINLGGFEQQLAQGLTGQAGTNAKYKAYSTSDNSGKVFGFYDSEMVKANFSKGPETEIPSQPGINLKGKIGTYQKGSGQGASGAAVVFLGPLDDTLIALLTVGAPDSAKQLKAGDSLVILFNDLNGPALQAPSGSSFTSPGASSPQPGTFITPGPTK